MKELKAAIKDLGNNKAAGQDGLVNEIFKNVVDLHPAMLTLFNRILSTGHFPIQWTEGIIVPIYKKGDRDSATNYRGVTLLDTLSKTFTKLINTRISGWAETEGKFADGQAGFRDGQSTADSLFLLHSIIEKWTARRGNKLYCGMIDFRKAFDYVNYDNLWHRLITTGVTGRMLTIIKSMYRQLKFRVRDFTGEISDQFTGLIGLRQGESLSPLLFSLLVNDIEKDLRSSLGNHQIKWGTISMAVLLYADDMCVVSSSPEGLQRGFEILDEFCQKWNLIVNTDKTEVIVFGHDVDHDNPPVITYRGTGLQVTRSFKYLGLTFSSRPGWDTVVNTLLGQARKATMSLRQKFHHYEFTPSEKYRLWLQLIEPILSYGSEVWGHVKAGPMEIMHRRFLREILGVRTGTRNDLLYHELGTIPLKPRRELKMVRFWAGVAQETSDKLSSRVYKLQVQENRRNWSTRVRDILTKYDHAHVWLNGPPQNVKAFMDGFKAKVWQIEQDRIWSEIDLGTGHTRFYRHLSGPKKRLEESAFMSLLDHEHVKTMSRFRLRTTKLWVVTGAWAGIALQDRRCVDCGVVDNKVHFLCECPRLQRLRSQYLPNITRNTRSSAKAVELMTSKDPRTLNNLCLFIKKGLMVLERAARNR